MIPNIIHNIWIQGYDNLPEKNKINKIKIKKLNPEWEFIIWDDKMISNLLKNKYPKVFEVYKKIKDLSGFLSINAVKSDIARYIIMKEYGGLYYDLDFECVSSFDELFVTKERQYNETIFIASSKVGFLDYIYPFDKPMYCSCFMAFEKDHPVWDKVINKIIKSNSKSEIGSALDKTLQDSDYHIVLLTKINGNYQCNENNSICYTPIESSWNFIRPSLNFINCYYKQIFLVIIVFIILYVVHHLADYNSIKFGVAPMIPGITGAVSQVVNIVKKNKKNEKKERKTK